MTDFKDATVLRAGSSFRLAISASNARFNRLGTSIVRTSVGSVDSAGAGASVTKPG
jgi:hypothetical protein